MSERVIECRGARFAVSDEGSGPLVVRAHGLTQGRDTDHEVGLVDWSELTARGFRVVSYDARGHGSSTGATDPDAYLWSSLAEDLLALLDVLSPGEPVRAVGISMGTATILTAMTMAPHRFSAAVLGAPPTAWEARGAQATVYEQLAGAVESTPSEQLAELFAEAVPPIFAEVPGWPHPPTVSPALLPAVLRGAGRSDLPEPGRVADVDVRTLVLGWETDPSHPIDIARRLADLVDADVYVSATVDDVRTWATRAAGFFHATP